MRATYALAKSFNILEEHRDRMCNSLRESIART